MNIEISKYLEKIKFVFSGDLSKNFKIYATLSLDNFYWVLDLVERVKKSDVRQKL